MMTRPVRPGGGKSSGLQRTHASTPPATTLETLRLVAVAVASVRVGSAGRVGGAVLVVEEDQTDGHGAQDEGEQGEEADGGRDGEAVDPGHALDRPHVHVDPAAEGEDQARGEAADVGAEDDEGAQDHAEAGGEVEGEGGEGAEAALGRGW